MDTQDALSGKLRRSNYALRLQTSLKEEAERMARTEGTTLNQLINVAVAEKLTRLRDETYFRDRAGPADVERALAFVRAPRGEPPRDGDEVPDRLKDRLARP